MRTRRACGASFVLVIVTASAGACSRTEQSDPQRLSVKTAAAPVVLPPSAPSSVASAGASASPAAGARPGDLAWAAPASWVKVWSPSPTRRATYRVPRVAGDAEDAEVTVAQAGGTVDANVARWAGRFSGATSTRSERTVAGLKVTVVEMRGTLQGMEPPARPGFALVGAIVGEGVDNTSFELIGPEKTVTAVRSDFDRMIDTVNASTRND